MRISQPTHDEEGQINLMPLIDMVFLLLIFFLIATTFAQEERDNAVQLPGTAQVQPLSAPPQQLIVNIRHDGEIVVNRKTLPGPDALRELLERVIREQPRREVLVRCDQRAIHKHFAGVVRVCRESGIAEAKIGYVFSS
jgi:biopolymer transport protein ExbD